MNYLKPVMQILVSISILIILAIILFFLTNPGFVLTPVSSFQVPELKGRNASIVMFRDAMLTASDSTLYFIDTKDSMNVKSYSYSILGKKDKSFHLDTIRHYAAPHVFAYLYERNQIVIADLGKDALDYYEASGSFIKEERKMNGHVGYMNVAEYRRKLYHVISQSSIKDKVVTTTLFEEQPGQSMKMIKRSVKSPKRALWAPIQIDSNGSMNIAILEVDVKNYRVKSYQNDRLYEFNIKRDVSIFPWSMKDYECHFLTGRNFVVVGIFGKDITPLTERVYSLKGKYLGTLDRTEMGNSQLVEIAGNNLVCFEPKTATIKVFRIQLRK